MSAARFRVYLAACLLLAGFAAWLVLAIMGNSGAGLLCAFIGLVLAELARPSVDVEARMREEAHMHALTREPWPDR